MKISHKGLSYVEVIIVLGIGAILTSLAVVSLGFVNRNNVTKSAQKLENAFSHAQNLSMTKNATNGSLSIYEDKGSYYYYFGTDSSVVYKFASSPCSVVGVDSEGHDVAIGSGGIKFIFVSNTGALDKGASKIANADKEIYGIKIKNKSNTKSILTIHPLTGKVTVD